jgi:phospholipase/carboxylesterase
MNHLNSRHYESGRLVARPATPTETGPSGMSRIGIGGDRDGLLYVPKHYSADTPLPLVIMLHGAGGNAQRTSGYLRPLADSVGVIVLVPESRLGSWDVLYGGFGPDIAFIDATLEQTFRRYAVDPERVIIGGFSDGASYALSVGLTNGDLFSHIAAFSPGFVRPGSEVGAPRIYISHGIDDEVLPINHCSRRIVPVLQQAGYDVLYREFNGPHTVPPDIALEALEWVTQGNTTAQEAGSR